MLQSALEDGLLHETLGGESGEEMEVLAISHFGASPLLSLLRPHHAQVAQKQN